MCEVRQKLKLRFKEIQRVNAKGKLLDKKYYINDKETSESAFNSLYEDEQTKTEVPFSIDINNLKSDFEPSTDFDEAMLKIVDFVRTKSDKASVDYLKQQLTSTAYDNFVRGEYETLKDIRKEISDRLVDLETEQDDIEGEN